MFQKKNSPSLDVLTKTLRNGEFFDKKKVFESPVATCGYESGTEFLMNS